MTLEDKHAPNLTRHWPSMPFWLLSLALIGITASWLPLVLIANARYSTKTEPRIQIPQDMGSQPKYLPQQTSLLFADGRAARPPVEGTVARGQLGEDDHYVRGFTRKLNPQTNKWDVQFFEGPPKQVNLNRATLLRGQERFNIYCAPCHGWDGYGAGPVHNRAVELQEPKWVPPLSLHGEQVRSRPDGHLYNTINNGIRNMPGYGGQIGIEDRWAIVAYVRALQFSQNAPVQAVPRDRVETLR